MLSEHPRLFFTNPELERLREQRESGLHARMWENIRASADWCLTRPIRREWIAPIEPDPIHENLYDRFFATMHDMAVAEYLSFAWAYTQDARYLSAAKDWALALCRVWVREADGEPDENKAYAVMRLLKGVAVSYDLLYERLSPGEREELRDMLLQVGRKYYHWYVANPGLAAETQEPHHGSVEAASFGVVALALLSEAPEVQPWLDLMIAKHVDWLLPHALTPSGIHNQNSNFWISILQYRITFMDALRRVTGRDLFESHRQFMESRVPLAAAAGPGVNPGAEYRQTHEAWIPGPTYGQMDYASPVLMFLAREYRRGAYQHIALWERRPGAIQKTRLVSRAGDMMLFNWGAYAYAWYDPSVRPAIEPGLPLSCLFKDPHENSILEMNEAYARASFEPGGLCVAVQRGAVFVHAGGLPVFVDFTPIWPPRNPVADLAMADEEKGSRSVITCTGNDTTGFVDQSVTLDRPSRLTIRRRTPEPQRWWCHGSPSREGNLLTWPEGVTLRVIRGNITAFDPQGYEEEKITGMGKLKLVDPLKTVYPVTVAEPDGGELIIEVTCGAAANPR